MACSFAGGSSRKIFVWGIRLAVRNRIMHYLKKLIKKFDHNTVPKQYKYPIYLIII